MTRTALLICGVALGCTGCRSRSDEGAPTKEAAQRDEPAAPGLNEWRAMYDAWEYPGPIPNFRLIDHDGREFSLADYEDHYLLVGFVFTGCPNPEACPLIMKKMRDVQQLWAQREKAGTTGGKKLHLFAFTLDPETDTPPVFKRWGVNYGVDFSNWTLATGPTELMTDALPSLFNVMALPGSKGSIRHTVKVALLQPGLHDYKEWLNNKFEPAQVVDLIVDHRPDVAKG